MYEYNNSEQNKENTYSQQVPPEVLRAQYKAQQRQEKKAASKRFWGKVATAACVGLAFGIVAGCSYAGVSRAIDHFFPQKQEALQQEEKNNVKVKEEQKLDVNKEESIKADKVDSQMAIVGMDVSQIAKNAMPSVVAITNKSVQEVRSMFGMGVREYESTSAGSGIIIGENDKELLIATNNHVVAKANTLSVCFADDEAYSATVKGTNPDLDLAVISVKLADISDSTKEAIKVIAIGDSDKLEIGQQVVAIGNALGYGQSVTTGIISALDRDMTDDNIDNPLIQTDAAINPGNSGGALLNLKGELVGINSAKIASTSIEGVGYAIPMSAATPIIEGLMNRETREEVDAKDAGYIGISGVSVDKNTSSMYGIPEGVYIQAVEENSPAQNAGLVKSDVIRKFDGVTVSSIADIRENLNYYEAGETVELQVFRSVDGEYIEKTIEITLGSREGTALDPNNEDSDTTVENEEIPEDDETIRQYEIDPFEFFGFGR